MCVSREINSTDCPENFEGFGTVHVGRDVIQEAAQGKPARRTRRFLAHGTHTVRAGLQVRYVRREDVRGQSGRGRFKGTSVRCRYISPAGPTRSRVHSSRRINSSTLQCATPSLWPGCRQGIGAHQS